MAPRNAKIDTFGSGCQEGEEKANGNALEIRDRPKVLITKEKPFSNRDSCAFFLCRIFACRKNGENALKAGTGWLCQLVVAS
ncbi:MAG TPA: hypothetical protein VMF66_20570 [Candidatus Acidoferrum sp.]|nr:hypothetical protein [Candidatus Acidoferrum sp.]